MARRLFRAAPHIAVYATSTFAAAGSLSSPASAAAPDRRSDRRTASAWHVGARIDRGDAFADIFSLVRRSLGVDLSDDVVLLDTGDDSDRPAAGRESLGIYKEVQVTDSS